MAITTGVGTGFIDVNSIVSQLMTIERRPLTLLQTKETKLNDQVSAYGKLTSALSRFQTAMTGLGDLNKFKAYSAASTDQTVLTASASSGAAAGTQSVEVVRNAEQHKLFSDTSFASTDTLASNTVTITVGATPFNVDISGMTLTEAAAAINDANDNAGVSATVSNVDAGYKLLLTSRETGSSNALTISFSGADPFSFTTINQDRNTSGGFTSDDLDAVMILNGNASLTATRSSNTVTDLIGGVTLNLKKAGTVSVSVERDTTTITKSAQEFVDSVNALRSTITELGKGALKGDSALISIQSQLVNVLNTAPTGLTGNYSYLSQVGLSTKTDGTMSLDSTALTTALSTDFSGVANLFANNDQGYAYRLVNLANSLLDSSGLVNSRTTGLKASVTAVKDQQDKATYRLEVIERRFRTQYTALDGLLASMNATTNYLTSQLASLPGAK